MSTDGFDMGEFERLLEGIDAEVLEVQFRALDGEDEFPAERFPAWAREMVRSITSEAGGGGRAMLVDPAEGEEDADPEAMYDAMESVCEELERIGMLVRRLPRHTLSVPHSGADIEDMDEEEKDELAQRRVHLELEMLSGDFMRLIRAMQILLRIIALGPQTGWPIMAMLGLAGVQDIGDWARSIQSQLAALATAGGVFDCTGVVQVVDARGES